MDPKVQAIFEKLATGFDKFKAVADKVRGTADTVREVYDHHAESGVFGWLLKSVPLIGPIQEVLSKVVDTTDDVADAVDDIIDFTGTTLDALAQLHNLPGLPQVAVGPGVSTSQNVTIDPFPHVGITPAK